MLPGQRRPPRSSGRSPTSAQSRAERGARHRPRRSSSQYVDWVERASLHRRPRRSRSPTAGPSRISSATALVNSLKLALLAFVIVVPLAILGGVIAALHGGATRATAPSRSAASRSTVVPEFVPRIVFIARLRHLARRAPGDRRRRRRARAPLDAAQVPHPAGARRSSSSSSATSRAWRGPGRSRRSTPTTRARPCSRGCRSARCVRRHVLRNALLPTITVVATQVGYLIGGLVVVEVLFNYHGLGQLLFTGRRADGLPAARGGVLVVGHRLSRRHAARRPRLLAPEPAHPLRRAPRHERSPPRRSRISLAPLARALATTRAARAARGGSSARSLRSKTFLVGAVIVRRSGSSARSSGRASSRTTRSRRTSSRTLEPPSAEHWFGTDRARPRRLLARHRRRARHPHRRAARDAARHDPRHRARARDGLLPRLRRRHPHALRRRPPRAPARHHRAARARRARASTRDGRSSSIGIVFAPDHRAHGARRRARGARARVRRRRRGSATSGRPTSCSPRSCPNVLPPILVEFTVRLGYAIFTVATLSFLGFGIQPPSPDWGLQIFEHYGLICGRLLVARALPGARDRHPRRRAST